MFAPIMIYLLGIAISGTTHASDSCTKYGCLSAQFFLGNNHIEEKTPINDKDIPCVSIKAKHPSDSSSKIAITEPGRYCLTEDLHSRFEMADRPTEGSMIDILASDVVLDLQGHTLGRGRLIVNPGGTGIYIGRGRTNIRIMGGKLENFFRGVFRFENPSTEELPVYTPQTNTYHFQATNIVIENVVFKNIRKNLDIRVSAQVPYGDNAAERRHKSQYPPCGGTDYFGRPLAKGQPCDDGK